MKRRDFLIASATTAGVITLSPLLITGCQKPKKTLKISLAQWSLHRAFENGDLHPRDFANISMDTYGIDAVEYVGSFYNTYAENLQFWTFMQRRAENAGVQSLLIMVDDEGDIGSADDLTRNTAVENHYKWVDAAKVLGCHSIRVNAFGASDRTTFKNAIVDGMGKLTDYAAGEGINVLIENHGLLSSDGQLIAEIIQQVGKPNLGTLPDFGNWCTSAKWGGTEGECDETYDIYKGVADLLPYAKGVSAKSYDFDEKGDQIKIDYYKMLKMVRNSDYDGHIGIEYEGQSLSEHDGILATKALIEKIWLKVN
ncbi:MAG: sugar phosphate isomerase/epimerase [Bacteroidia bacterium]|nr:sugar phosphate isomerase/epimerase [Bacteroidia bacterium]